jgi:hypothetical protein
MGILQEIQTGHINRAQSVLPSYQSTQVTVGKELTKENTSVLPETIRPTTRQDENILPKLTPAVAMSRESMADPAPITASPVSTLPAPIPCPICSCPAVWLSIYDDPALAEVSAWRCCDCDEPPAWSMIRARLMLVNGPAGKLAWWPFQRLNAKRWPLPESDHPGGSDGAAGHGEGGRDVAAFSFGPKSDIPPYRPGLLGTAVYHSAARRIVGAGHPPIESLQPPTSILEDERSPWRRRIKISSDASCDFDRELMEI